MQNLTPSHGPVGRQWNLQEAGPSGRKLVLWARHEGGAETLAPLPLFMVSIR